MVDIQKGPEKPIVFVHVDDLNYAQLHGTSHGISALLQLNHYLPVWWLSDQALMLITLHLHSQWTFSVGMR